VAGAEAGADADGGSGLEEKSRPRKREWPFLVAGKQSWDFEVSIRQPRETSDNPMLNAFCRVAPSVRFSALAILAA
jgi:hypothetical protein